MLEKLLAGMRSDRGLRAAAITAAVIMITAIASFGANKSTDQPNTLTSDPFDSELPADDADTTPTPGPTGGTGGGPRSGTVRAPDGSAPLASGAPLSPGSDLDFGLRTQGITADEVKVGFSYNQAGCGDQSLIEAMIGSAQAGDFEKSVNAFARYINDTGGIGGRKYTPLFFDDGGSGCPEKSVAAAVDMAEEAKVFLAVPGLHVVSDYVISRKVPVWGGRDDPASLSKYGPNGLQIFEPIEPTLDAWVSFGKHYLKTNPTTERPCIIRIESGASGNWDIPEKLLVAKMRREGIGIRDKDIIVFQDNAATAQQQATTIAIRARDNGCQHVYFMAGNPIGLIFITSAATQNNWFPHKWTWTSYTALVDTELAGGLMDQRQWENAVGLTIRVPPNEHPKYDNCKKVYRKYFPNDGQDGSAAVLIACASVLPTAEAMRRGVKRTGKLDSNAYLLGADAIRDDFYYDAHVPMSFSFPSEKGPFKTRGFTHWTVGDWNSDSGRYDFPKFPCYYKTFKPNGGGCEDLRAKFK